MTHLYVIAAHGLVVPGLEQSGPALPTAVAWAADRILAVGSDAMVRSISRGDSTFLDLRGAVVTALPADPVRAEMLLRGGVPVGPADDAAERARELARRLVDGGRLRGSATIEAGSPADLAFWAEDETGGPLDARPSVRLLAILRAGVFERGDRKRGPFPDAEPVP